MSCFQIEKKYIQITYFQVFVIYLELSDCAEDSFSVSSAGPNALKDGNFMLGVCAAERKKNQDLCLFLYIAVFSFYFWLSYKIMPDVSIKIHYVLHDTK